MVVRLIFKWILIFAFLATSTLRAEVTLFLNQEVYYEGSPVTITVKSSTNNNAKPDLSVLAKNFEILGTSTSSQINIFNGKRSFSKTWIIELQPKVRGKIAIPEIQVGSEKTRAFEITIKELPPEVKAETSKHIIIESFIDIPNNETYVQQQIPYTVRLLYDDSMLSKNISPFSIDNAVIEQLQREKRYRTTRGKKQFKVLERHYVISPEKSGVLKIPEITVKGTIALSGGDSPKLRKRMNETDMLNQFFNDSGFQSDSFFRDFLGGFSSKRRHGPSKPFTLSSKAIEVDVLPVPSAFTGESWLPAEALIIEDSWARQPPELKVGEPVTRTLVFQAKGLAGSQIPEIKIPKPKGIKIYPEYEKSETSTDGKTIFGIQQIHVTYIPSETGKIEIPAMKIDWWNTKEKKQEVFTLPKWTLNIAAGAQGITPEYKSESADTEGQALSKSIDSPDDSENESREKPRDLFSLISYLFLIPLIVLAIWLMYMFKKYREINPPVKRKQTVDITKIRTPLIEACERNDKKQSASLVILYGQALWNDHSIQNLGSLSKHLFQGVHVIKELELSLYSSDSKEWDGRKLKKLILDGFQLRIEPEQVKENDSLAPLYPF